MRLRNKHFGIPTRYTHGCHSGCVANKRMLFVLRTFTRELNTILLKPYYLLLGWYLYFNMSLGTNVNSTILKIQWKIAPEHISCNVFCGLHWTCEIKYAIIHIIWITPIQTSKGVHAEAQHKLGNKAFDFPAHFQSIFHVSSLINHYFSFTVYCFFRLITQVVNKCFPFQFNRTYDTI